ncbi:RNA polymerase subunit sigma [Burkholderia pseudomallei]|nr:RNA polymerase subunit sigma [Burkholderia pseudomallei]KIX39305.1 RNA polymerase sigma factor [Burkholderia pseudomallei]OMO13802.1 RNA polymerase subunit sigma [Burkholderia pseudomallei]OMZ25304.1 RNA polymerase subunit sigma [Burkholderia pseudomallei]OMZ40136.1 RNA polymerase subunit sigma [Burkholderia pseudomallei]
MLIDELTRQPTMRRANRSITMILRSWAFMRSIEFV